MHHPCPVVARIGLTLHEQHLAGAGLSELPRVTHDGHVRVGRATRGRADLVAIDGIVREPLGAGADIRGEQAKLDPVDVEFATLVVPDGSERRFETWGMGGLRHCQEQEAREVLEVVAEARAHSVVGERLQERAEVGASIHEGQALLDMRQARELRLEPEPDSEVGLARPDREVLVALDQAPEDLGAGRDDEALGPGRR